MFNYDPINIFFSCDDGYVPFMAVTLASLKENRDEDREYHIRVLHTGISKKNIRAITEEFDSDSFRIRFVNISREVDRLAEKLHTRDYYSKSTYYRLFIPELFPELDKALYLDCDIVVTGDISELYDVHLGNDLVGAVTDGIICGVDKLSIYATRRIGLKDKKYYFNAGVLLMNLKEMRSFGFEDIFLALLGSVRFNVAQDQDYLNVICKGRVRYVSGEWNVMPSFGLVPECDAKLIHYNLDNKPWRKDGVQFGELFWSYAEKTAYLSDIQRVYELSTPEMREAADKATENIFDEAHSQGLDEIENEIIKGRISRIVPAMDNRIIARSKKYITRLVPLTIAFFGR